MTSLQDELARVRPLLNTSLKATSTEPFKPTVKVDVAYADPCKYEVVYDLSQEPNVASASTFQQPQPVRQKPDGGWNGKDRRSQPAAARPHAQFHVGDDVKINVPLTEDRAKKYLDKIEEKMVTDRRTQGLDTATRIVTLVLGVLSIVAAGAAIYAGVNSKSRGDPRA